MNDDRKDLPPASSPAFLARVREVLQTYLGSQGDPSKRGVMLGELVEAGLVELRPGYNGGKNPISGPGPAVGSGGGGAVSTEPDLTPPPMPTGFTATGAISNILLEQDRPIYTQGHGHATTRVFGATWISGPLPTFSDAVEITQFAGTVFAYATNPATTWHLWVKWESIDGVLSTTPAGGTNGIVVTTGQDVSRLVFAMTGAGNPFTVVPVDVTLPDGSVVPAGTYTADAFIHNGQITNAKIANLAVDNAKIASMSVSKLTAGSISVGDYIQSTGYVANTTGWRINGNGTAEFSAASIRGLLTAAQIDTRGLTIKDMAGNIILAAGTPLTSGYLAIGNGGNLLPNAGFNSGIGNWAIGYNSTGGTNYTGPGWDLAGSDWVPLGGHQIGVNRSGTTGTAAGFLDVNYVNALTVVSGGRYELTGYLASHRCPVFLCVAWYKRVGTTDTYITEVNIARVGTSNNGGQLLSTWERVGSFVTAPADASYCRIYIRGGPTTSSDPYYWATRIYFAQATAAQTEFSPWSDGPRTGTFSELSQITPGNASTYIANAAISTAQIGVAQVDYLRLAGGATSVSNAATFSADNVNTSLVAQLSISMPADGYLKIDADAISEPGGSFYASGNKVRQEGALYYELYKNGSLIEFGSRSAITKNGYAIGYPFAGNPTGDGYIRLSLTRFVTAVITDVFTVNILAKTLLRDVTTSATYIDGGMHFGTASIIGNYR